MHYHLTQAFHQLHIQDPVKTAINTGRIPTEILRLVFQEALPQRRENGIICYRSSVAIPLCISRVCRIWRAVSLSYGDLWSHLCLEYWGSATERRQQVVRDVFDTWLERTGRSPLNFLFHCTVADGEDEAYPQAQYIIKRLLEHQWRWRDVDFNWDIGSRFLGISLTNMTMLTSLILTFGSRPADDWNIHTRKRLLRAEGYPELYEDPLPDYVLSDYEFMLDDESWISYIRYDEMPTAIVDISKSPLVERLVLQGEFVLLSGKDLTYKKLEVFDLYSGCIFRPGARIVQSCLKLLRSSPSLTTFGLTIFGDPGSFHYPGYQHPLVLHNLRTLHVSDDDISGPMINRLTLPSLDSLSYTSKQNDVALLRLIQRSNFPLTKLGIWGYPQKLTEITLIPVIHELSYLQELVISDAIVSTRLFCELTVVYKYYRNSEPTETEESSDCEWPLGDSLGRPMAWKWTPDNLFTYGFDPAFKVVEERAVSRKLKRLSLRGLQFSEDGSDCLRALRDMIKSRNLHLGTLQRVFYCRDANDPHCHEFSDFEGIIPGDYEAIEELSNEIDGINALRVQLMILSNDELED